MDLPKGIRVVSDKNLRADEAYITLNGIPVRKIVNIKMDCPVVESFNQRQTLPEYNPSLTLEQIKDHWVLSSLKYCNWNTAKASKLLGIGRETVYRVKRKYETK